MKLIFLIIVLLLLLYNFYTINILFYSSNNIALIWEYVQKKYIIHIFPQNVVVMIDENINIYLEKGLNDYIPSLKIERTGHRVLNEIVNYQYLITWSGKFPKIVHYPSDIINVFDVINYLGSKNYLY